MCLEKEKSQSVDKDARHAPKPYDRKPSFQSIKRESSPGRIPASAPPATKKRKHSTPSTSATPVPATGGRSTLNSLSVPSPVFNDRLPPPHADLKIPEPPSRSPSPPTRVIPQGRGNKYTDEDRQFFLKFISWRLKQDPTLTRNDLCNMLAEKVCGSADRGIFPLTEGFRPPIILRSLGRPIGQIAMICRIRFLLLLMEKPTCLMETMTTTSLN